VNECAMSVCRGDRRWWWVVGSEVDQAARLNREKGAENESWVMDERSESTSIR
jgi:hypothetical protein